MNFIFLAAILKLSYDSGVEVWEVLPYELAVARRYPSAVSLNTNNFIATEEDCSVEFLPISEKTLYGFSPLKYSKVFLPTHPVKMDLNNKLDPSKRLFRPSILMPEGSKKLEMEILLHRK